MMRSWLLIGSALLAACCRPAFAAGIPDWAQGRWVAVAAIGSTGEAGFGEDYMKRIPTILAHTQVLITPDTIQESNSPFNLALAWGANVSAVVKPTSLKPVFDYIGQAYVFGEAVVYEPTALYPTASLRMESCGEAGGYFEPQTTITIYRFAKIRHQCVDYNVYRFPDDDHIAMTRKEVARGNEPIKLYDTGVIVFERVKL